MSDTPCSGPDLTHDLAAVLAPVETARGLPNAHYIDPQMFEAEKQAVLFANWAGIGFGADIPDPGDAKPVTFLGQPLLMVRDHTGEIAVFQNTCRHRGMILVAEPRNIRGTLRCPYHSWCYGLDGALRAAPHVGGPGQNTHADLDFDQLGLWRVRSHVWRDVVFVNIDGSAPAFEQAHADLIRRWADFDHPLYPGGDDACVELRLAANWKLAVENYCESYHLPWVHPGLNSYSRLEDHYNITQLGAYSGQGTHVYTQITGARGETLTDFPGLAPKWDKAAEYIVVYPNVLLGVQRDHSFAFILDPVDCETTVERIALYYATPAGDDPDPQQAELRQRNAQLWATVFQEDVAVVEGMQQGRHGRQFDGGRFSPVMDGPTHCFHHWVASQMLRAGA